MPFNGCVSIPDTIDSNLLEVIVRIIPQSLLSLLLRSPLRLLLIPLIHTACFGLAIDEGACESCTVVYIVSIDTYTLCFCFDGIRREGKGEGKHEQDFLCFFVRARLPVLVAVVLVCFHGFVGGGAGDELVAEAGCVVTLDLWWREGGVSTGCVRRDQGSN